jgi:predicted HicB family RNase H-like nuclease
MAKRPAPSPDPEPSSEEAPPALRGDRKPVTIYLQSEEHRQLKIEAAERGMSMSEIVSEALRMRVRLVGRD